MKITFCGGAGAVTGANYLLDDGRDKILVDCGLKQGGAVFEKENWKPFFYNPAEIKAVFITHSHLDHIGLLPKLFRDGFRGKIFSTAPTKDFSELLLKDSQHILHEDAIKFKRPLLYDEKDIEGVMTLWEGGGYHQTIEFGKYKSTYYNAGHILGSGSILMESNKVKTVFSGDLGNSPAPIIGTKEVMPEAHYALIESTYGNRFHEPQGQTKEILKKMILETIHGHGVLMIPAFAMERTQHLLFELQELINNHEIPRMPVFLDSPLAIKVTTVYERYSNYFDKGSQQMIQKGIKLFDFESLKKTLTTTESKEINSVPAPKIVIAGAGMSHAGRILHHELRYLPDPRSTLLIVGYQTEGSLGRAILDGEREVMIMNERIPVRCHVKAIGGYSAHADQRQLLEWLNPNSKKIRKVFVVQGEEGAPVLRQKIEEELGLEAVVPETNEEYDLV